MFKQIHLVNGTAFVVGNSHFVPEFGYVELKSIRSANGFFRIICEKGVTLEIPSSSVLYAVHITNGS